MHTKLTNAVDPVDLVIEDAKRIQATRLLHQVAVSAAVIATFFYGLMLFVLPAHALRWLLALGAIDAAMIAVLFLARRGVLWLARVVVVLLMWGVVTALCLTGGGIHSPVIAGYLVIIFASGVLFTKKAGVAAGVWCSLTALALVWLEQAGLLSARVVVADSVLLWWNFVAIAAFVVVLQYVASLTSENVLRTALSELADRQRRQMALQERVAQYTALTSNALDGFVLVARDGQVIDANTAYCEMTGYSRDELRAMTIMELDADETPAVAARHRLDTETKGSDRFMARHRCKDGHIIEVEISATFVQESACFAAFIRDVTTSQRAQVALRESEERFHTLAELCPAGIYMTNDRGDCVYANRRWCDMAGMSVDEAAGQGWIQRHHPEDRENVAAAWYRMVESKGTWGLEYRFQRPDGRITWVLGLATAVHNEQGELTGYIGANMDIGDLKQAEEALRETRDQMKTIVEGIADGVSVLDASGRLIYVNSASASASGYSSAAAMMQDAQPGTVLNRFDILDDAGQPFPYDQLPSRLALAGIKSPAVTMCFSLKNSAEQRWALVQSTPIFDEGRHVRMVVTISHDMTERRLEEKRLRDDVQRRRVLLDVYQNAAGLTEKELYDYVLERAVQLTDSTIGFLHRVSADQQSADLTVCNSEAQRHCMTPAQTHYPIAEAGNWIDCLRFRRPVVYNDYATSANHKGLPDGHVPVQRFMSVPIFEGDKVVFVFGVGNKASDYGDNDVINVQLIAAEVQKMLRQRSADDALRQKTEEINRFFSLSHDLFCIADHDGYLRTLNPVWEQTLGYTREELMAHTFLDFVHPADVPATRQAMAALAAQQEVVNFVNRYRCKDGDYRWLEWRAVPAGAVTYSAARDITRRRQAELERERMLAQLRLNQEQLHALSRRVLEVQEAERRHIARELHDEIGQSLTALKLLLERRDTQPDDDITARLSDARGVLGHLIATVRDLSLDLRPAMLDDLGLLPALLWFLERYRAQTRVGVSFHHTDVVGRRFGTDIETAAYRIVQEALTNVARHAAVNAATVRMWANRDMLSILIADQGQGFDLTAVLATSEASGLAGMNERAVLLDGHLTIESTPGGGTQVTAQLPLPGPTEGAAHDNLDRTG